MRRRNAIWIDGTLWLSRIEGLKDGIVAKGIIRTDRKVLGGHHPLVMFSQLAVEAIAFVVVHQSIKDKAFDLNLLNNLNTMRRLEALLAKQSFPIHARVDGWLWSEGWPSTTFVQGDNISFLVEEEARRLAIRLIPTITMIFERRRRELLEEIRDGRKNGGNPPCMYVLDIPEPNYDEVGI